MLWGIVRIIEQQDDGDKLSIQSCERSSPDEEHTFLPVLIVEDPETAAQN